LTENLFYDILKCRCGDYSIHKGKEKMARYGVIVNERETFPKYGDLNLSVIGEDGKIIIFDNKYIRFQYFERAVEVLWKATKDDEITQEEFVILIKKMWDLGLR